MRVVIFSVFMALCGFVNAADFDLSNSVEADPSISFSNKQKVSRLGASSALDTYDGDSGFGTNALNIALMYIDCHFQSDGFGSDGEMSKT